MIGSCVWWSLCAASERPVVGSIVRGNLSLEDNQLSELPASFGSISVGLSLDLRGNELEALPGATVAQLYCSVVALYPSTAVPAVPLYHCTVVLLRSSSTHYTDVSM